MHRTRNAAYGQPYRGFESLSLRQRCRLALQRVRFCSGAMLPALSPGTLHQAVRANSFRFNLPLFRTQSSEHVHEVAETLAADFVRPLLLQLPQRGVDRFHKLPAPLRQIDQRTTVVRRRAAFKVSKRLQLNEQMIDGLARHLQPPSQVRWTGRIGARIPKYRQVTLVKVGKSFGVEPLFNVLPLADVAYPDKDANERG